MKVLCNDSPVGGARKFNLRKTRVKPSGIAFWNRFSDILRYKVSNAKLTHNSRAIVYPL